MRPSTNTYLLALLGLGLGLTGCPADEPDPLVTDDDDVVADDDDDSSADDDDDSQQNQSYPDPTNAVLPNAADWDFTSSRTFTMDDVAYDFSGATYGTSGEGICVTGCEDQVIVGSGATLYPVESMYGFDVQDFIGSEAKVLDGDYGEGWVGNIAGPASEHWGVAAQAAKTNVFRTGYPLGAWCAGVGADLVKCSSEHYVVMEHVLTCFETVPYLFFDPVTGEPTDPDYTVCQSLSDELDKEPAELDPYEFDLIELAVGDDYSASAKDDGKLLFRWGTWDKRPTDLRFNVTVPVPEEWKTGDTVYRITDAKLAIVHTVTNSPNDQIRPEDYENEGATGRKPAYEVLADGTWLSTVDCRESDGDIIPAGTVLKNPPYADPDGWTSDLIGGLTNAWYTSMDRDPFETDPATGIGPRWRLKAPKFGQDIPGLEIPAVDCAELPLQNGEQKYTRGDLTTTVINLLDWPDGESPLALSTGWTEIGAQELLEDNITINGMPLTQDLDLAIYIKGEGKPMFLYSAHLFVNYEAE